MLCRIDMPFLTTGGSWCAGTPACILCTRWLIESIELRDMDFCEPSEARLSVMALGTVGGGAAAGKGIAAGLKLDTCK